jgi:LAO/AO transport system kinase
VAAMTDLFVLLTLPNAGDELQGIKRGIMELADLCVVNKADTDPHAANRAQAELNSALHLLTPRGAVWQPKAVQASALTGAGVQGVWEAVQEYRRVMAQHLSEKRRQQTLGWFDDLLREAVWRRFLNGHTSERLRTARQAVFDGTLTPVQGVLSLLATGELGAEAH